MTPDEIAKINRSLFAEWANHLTEVHATAQILIALGHDEKAGMFQLIMTDDVATSSLFHVIRGLLGILAGKGHWGPEEKKKR